MTRDEFIYHWMIAHIVPIVDAYRKDSGPRSISERDVVRGEVAKASLMYEEIAEVLKKRATVAG